MATAYTQGTMKSNSQVVAGLPTPVIDEGICEMIASGKSKQEESAGDRGGVANQDDQLLIHRTKGA